MTLLYFDGFDQYVDIPAPTPASPCSFARGISNQLATPSDPTVLTPLGITSYFCKIYGEDRVWRVPTMTTASIYGSHYYDPLQTSPIYAASTSSYAISLNAGRPVTETKKLVIGYKIKHADNQYRYFSSAQTLPLAVFSSSATFTTDYYTWAVVLGKNNVVSIRPMVSGLLYGSTFNDLGQEWPASWLAAGQSPVLGTCNFVYGTCSNTTLGTVSPAITQLAANTVEIEITDAGKVSVWINNQFIGSCIFIPAVAIPRFASVQYVKVGFLPSYYSQNTSTQRTQFHAFSGITDMYLLNGLGTTNNKRLGKVKVLSRLPTSDSSVQFTRPDTSNTNAEVAASVPPVFGKALIGAKEGDTDLYGAPAFNFTNEAILGMSILTTGYKTDPSGNDIAPVIKVDGVKYVGDTNVAPVSASLMKTKQSIYELNPKTNLPFTKTDLDASTFGVTVVAPVVV